MYKIVRHYMRDPRNGGHLETKRRTIKTGLSLEEAQAHCSDPKTSTHGKPDKSGWTWFDGYDET